MNYMTDANANNTLFLVDSNILVYAYEEQESDRKRDAGKLLSKAFAKKAVYAVSSQNLAEFVAAYLLKGKGDIKKLQRAVKGIKNHENFIKINYSSETVASAVALSHSHSTPFWDALIAATMLENNIFHIYTENTKDFPIQGIKAINPFEKSKKEANKS